MPATAYIPMTPNLGFPKINLAQTATPSAASPVYRGWKVGDIIRVTPDNANASNTSDAFNAIYLAGATGVTAGGQASYNPVTMVVTNGAATAGATTIPITALSAANSTSLYGWFIVGPGASVPAAGMP